MYLSEKVENGSVNGLLRIKTDCRLSCDNKEHQSAYISCTKGWMYGAFGCIIRYAESDPDSNYNIAGSCEAGNSVWETSNIEYRQAFLETWRKIHFKSKLSRVIASHNILGVFAMGSRWQVSGTFRLVR